MTALAVSGKFASGEIMEAAQGVVAFSDLTGESVDKAVKVFEKLQSSPLKTLKELDDQYHFLTASQYAQVASLEQLGDKFGAAELAVKLFTDAMVNRDEDVKKTLSGWETGLNAIVHPIDAIGAAWGNAMAKMESYAQHYGTLKTSIDASVDALVRLASFGMYQGNYSKAGNAGGQGVFLEVNHDMSYVDQLAQAKERSKAIDIDYTDKINKESDALTKSMDVMGKSKLAIVERMEQQEIAAKITALGRDLTNQEYDAIFKQYSVLEAQAKAYDAASAAKKKHADATKVDLEAQNALFQANQRMDNILAKLTGDTNAYVKAQADYQRTMTQIVAASLAQAQAEERVLASRGEITKQAMEAKSAMLARAAAQADAAVAAGDDAKAVQVWTDALKAAGIPQDELNKLVDEFTKAQEGAEAQLQKTDA